MRSLLRYGGIVQFCEETDLLLLLAAIAKGSAHYHSGIKMKAVAQSGQDKAQ